jgi:hypothetical protein
MSNMPQWLTVSVMPDPIEVPTLAIRLLLAWAAGWVVARIATGGGSRDSEDTLPATLVLMSILIAMATQIIGDNVARAFSLVGALSIVRFRTAVPTSRDVAFVLASVVVGMAIGAGQIVVAALGLVVVAIASRLDRSATGRSSPRADAENAFAVGGLTPQESRFTLQVGIAAGDLPLTTLAHSCQAVRLVSASTSRKGASMTYVYAATPKPDVPTTDIIAALNRIPDVESIVWES